MARDKDKALHRSCMLPSAVTDQIKKIITNTNILKYLMEQEGVNRMEKMDALK